MKFENKTHNRNEPKDFVMKKKIKLLLVDDHPLVRKGIRLCLAPCKNMEVVGELADAREVVETARELQPDVVLMDIGMPQIGGLAATCLLRKALPEIKVLILSIHDQPDQLRQAMQAGAKGYLLKGASAEELVRAVEAVHGGETYFSMDLMRATLNHTFKVEQTADEPRLTEREREVLVLVAEGRSNKESASALGVSVRTVETHREHLMRKLKIHSAAGLTRFAVAKGFVPANNGAAEAHPPDIL